MVKKGYTPEQIINKLREAEILPSGFLRSIQILDKERQKYYIECKIIVWYNGKQFRKPPVDSSNLSVGSIVNIKTSSTLCQNMWAGFCGMI